MTRFHPVIGITVNADYDRKRFWLPEAYCRRVIEAGGLPLLLPLFAPEQVGALFILLDGLLFPGGSDPAPLYFGREPLPGLGQVDPRRDELELCLAREALHRDLPLLGICRGLQILNIAAGGTLYQDLSGPSWLLHMQRAPRHCPSHTIRVCPGTRLASILAGPPPPGATARFKNGIAEHLAVNSFHHQGIELLGRGLIAGAIAPDGLPEALESPAHRFILGVQWHPESLDHPAARALFAALVTAAGQSPARRPYVPLQQ